MNFLNFYKHPKNIRYNSFEFALIEAKTRCHRVVVETGVARGKIKFFFFSKINWKDGMSTMILSDYAKYMSEGEKSISQLDDYTSHNTERLDIKKLKKILLDLDYIKKELKNI